MVDVAQLVRALDCGSRGRRFKSGLPPIILALDFYPGLFISKTLDVIQFRLGLTLTYK